MEGQERLYGELKGDIEAVADPLFRATEFLLRKRSRFLPHGAILTREGEAKLMMAAPPNGEDKTSSVEVLPALHDVLRDASQDPEVQAVAVCEDVTITPSGEKPTQAIKVLVEHRRGLSVALYLPYRRSLRGKITTGAIRLMPADPEVRAWQPSNA
jgi:hypothetical protein